MCRPSRPSTTRDMSVCLRLPSAEIELTPFILEGVMKDTHPSLGLRLTEIRKAGKPTKQKEGPHIVTQTRVNGKFPEQADSVERSHGAGDPEGTIVRPMGKNSRKARSDSSSNLCGTGPTGRQETQVHCATGELPDEVLVQAVGLKQFPL